jgi:hypothetical protein
MPYDIRVSIIHSPVKRLKTAAYEPGEQAENHDTTRAVTPRH